jgi:hypothetical protein
LSGKKIEKENFKATIMLLVVSLTFVALTLPYTVSYFIMKVSILRKNNTNMKTLVVIQKIADILYMLNHSINFFLYILTRRIFRKLIKEKLKCDCFCIDKYNRRKRQQQRAFINEVPMETLNLGHNDDDINNNKRTIDFISEPRVIKTYSLSSKSTYLKELYHISDDIRELNHCDILQPEDIEDYWQKAEPCNNIDEEILSKRNSKSNGSRSMVSKMFRSKKSISS